MSTAAELRREAAESAARAKRLRVEAAEIERAERLARTPRMPHIPDGEHRVVLFEKLMSGRSYGFAAVGWRIGGQVRWTVTGNDGEYRHNWAGLLAYVGETNWSTIRLVTGTSPLLAPGDEPAASEKMGPFGKPYAGGGLILGKPYAGEGFGAPGRMVSNPFASGGMYANEL